MSTAHGPQHNFPYGAPASEPSADPYAGSAYGQSAPTDSAWQQPQSTDPYASPYGAPASQPSADPYATAYTQPPAGGYGGSTAYAPPATSGYDAGQQWPTQQQPGYAVSPYAGQAGYGAPTYGVAGYGALPGAENPTERSSASMSWWLTILIGWIAPLIFMGADKSPFTQHHARMSMNVQLSMIIVWFVAALLALPTLFLSLLFPIIWNIVVVIQGATKANNGELYDNPPLVIKFLN